MESIEGEPVEENDRFNLAEPVREVDDQAQEGLLCVRRVEPIALDRPVDDLLGQIERHVVGRHRQEDDEQYPDLLPARMCPDIFGEILIHI